MLTAMPYLRQLAALGSLSALSAALMRSLDTVAQPPATQAADELASQTFLITGSTEGIGRHTAQLLAQAHATVLLHGREARAVQRAIRDLRRATSNLRVYGYAYDLASLDQTRTFAAHVRRDTEQFFGGGITCLINNAGVFHKSTRVTEDGLGETWAVNTAAPFLLTGSLLDLITQRIVNVSSISMANRLDWQLLQQGCRLGGHEAYGASKLALNMWTYRLARLLAAQGQGVTANCIDPGTTNTRLCYAAWGPGADTAPRAEESGDEYWAATAPALGRASGRYYVNRKLRDSPAFSYDKAAQQRLWLCLQRQTGLEF